MSKSIATCLKASDCFLECFLICLTNTHNFTYGAHLSTKFVLYTFEFFKCPTSKFDYNVISIRNILIQCSIFSTWNIFQCKPCCQHCWYQSNRETCRFRSKCRRTRCSWVNFDNDISVCFWIMRPLYITSTDYLNRIYNFMRFFLQTFLYFFWDCKHRSWTEWVTCMDTKRVNIFNETYCNHITFRVTNHLKL